MAHFDENGDLWIDVMIDNGHMPKDLPNSGMSWSIPHPMFGEGGPHVGVTAVNVTEYMRKIIGDYMSERLRGYIRAVDKSHDI